MTISARYDTKHRVPASRCPCCGLLNDGASGGPTKPEPGDLTVCIGCAAMLQFGQTLELERLSRPEFEELPAEAQHELLRVALAIAICNEKVSARRSTR